MISANIVTAINIIGQVILGGYFIYNGIKHFKDNKDYTAYAGSMKVPAPSAAVFVTGAMLVLGGLGIFFNMYVRSAIVILVIFLIGTAFMMHAFWKLENPGEKSAQKIQFLKNIAILGALLMLF